MIQQPKIDKQLRLTGLLGEGILKKITPMNGPVTSWKHYQESRKIRDSTDSRSSESHFSVNKMSGPGSEEPLSNISDTSFVILGPSSLSNQGDDEGLHENSNPESSISSKSANTCLDLNKLGNNDSKCMSKCSFSEESIQEKLNELVKENYHLKETLSQNNLAIKSQLDTFFMWQQEVLKTHESHKQKFLETKDLILKLRMENLSLKKQLEEPAHGFSILSVNDSSSQIEKKFDNSDVLKERIKEFENICNELASKNENLEVEKQKLLEELGDAKKEVSRLKRELEEVTVENMFLKQRTENFQKNSNESISYKSLPNSEARAQISNLFKQLEEEKSKVSKLKEALKETKYQNKAETSLSKGSTEDELVHYIDKLSDMNHSLDMQNQRISGFHSWVTLVKGNLKENQRDEQVDCNPKSEIKEFKGYPNLEENGFNENQESVEELKKQFTKLLDDYKTLQQQFNSLHGDSHNIEKYKEEIAGLSTELQAKDAELISKQQECNDLKEEIKKLNLEWEEKVSVLQIQAELYRSDFDSEREAREQLIREKEEMAEQVIFLQSQIQELEKSLNERSNLTSSGKNTTYKCPKCLTSFTNIRNLEGHVDDCLDTFMYP